MKIKEIISSLESWAPSSYQESYDNSGLIVGDGNVELTKALITLDATEDVIDEAINEGCNLVIAHHPIVFRGLKQLNGKNYVERVVIKAIKNDVAIYAIHTNLDNVNTGVNYKIAEKIGLKELKILAPKSETLSKLVTFVPTESKETVLETLFDAGAGEIGNYDQCSFQLEGTGTFRPNEKANPHIGEQNKLEEVRETRIEVIFPSHLQGKVLGSLKQAHPYEEVAYYLSSLVNKNQEVGSGMIGTLEEPIEAMEFLSSLKEKMELNCIRHTPIVKEKVRKIAICGGAGSFLLSKAKGQGADVFVTGDFKYHEFFDAEDKIIIADIGHYESEKYTKDLIYDYLKENFTNIALRLSNVNTNPINYL